MCTISGVSSRARFSVTIPPRPAFAAARGRRVAAVRYDGAPESRRPREETSSSRKRRREGWLRAFHTYGFHPNEPNRPARDPRFGELGTCGPASVRRGATRLPGPFAAAITSLAR
jgi:hypothetical protein